MRRLSICLLLLLTACQTTYPLEIHDVPKDMPRLERGIEQRPIVFEGVFVDMDRGTPFLFLPYWRWQIPNVKVGMNLCNATLKYRWTNSERTWTDEESMLGSNWSEDAPRYVQRPLSRAGYDIVMTGESLFRDRRNLARAELLLSAKITDIKMNMCFAHSVWLGKDMEISAGEGLIAVEWEIYDAIREQSLAVIKTEGIGQVDDFSEDGLKLVLLRALENAAEHLGRTQTFRRVMMTMNPNEFLPRQEFKPIIIGSGYRQFTKPIQDNYYNIREAVISVRAEGRPNGAGFFINGEGYALTSGILVGDAKTVQVSDSKGVRYPAEVIRTDKVRDVALIKADLRGNRSLPLDLSDSFMKPLTPVYAMGAPYTNRNRSTIVMGHLNKQQYDSKDDMGYLWTTITSVQGFSGAPLTDAYGHVIGIGLYIPPERPETAFTRWTPIVDALEALNIQMDYRHLK